MKQIQAGLSFASPSSSSAFKRDMESVPFPWKIQTVELSASSRCASTLQGFQNPLATFETVAETRRQPNIAALK